MGTNSEKSSVERQIDENLKRVYQDAVNQDLPDKFLELIAKLSTEKKAKQGQSDDK